MGVGGRFQWNHHHFEWFSLLYMEEPMSDQDTPKAVAEVVHEERLKAASTEEERQKIRKQGIEPMLCEPKDDGKEWDG